MVHVKHLKQPRGQVLIFQVAMVQVGALAELVCWQRSNGQSPLGEELGLTQQQMLKHECKPDDQEQVVP